MKRIRFCQNYAAQRNCRSIKLQDMVSIHPDLSLSSANEPSKNVAFLFRIDRGDLIDVCQSHNMNRYYGTFESLEYLKQILTPQFTNIPDYIVAAYHRPYYQIYFLGYMLAAYVVFDYEGWLQIIPKERIVPLNSVQNGFHFNQLQVKRGNTSFTLSRSDYVELRKQVRQSIGLKY